MKPNIVKEVIDEICEQFDEDSDDIAGSLLDFVTRMLEKDLDAGESIVFRELKDKLEDCIEDEAED
jgi:hypothetical protein